VNVFLQKTIHSGDVALLHLWEHSALFFAKKNSLKIFWEKNLLKPTGLVYFALSLND